MTEIKNINISSAGRTGAIVLGSAGFLMGCIYVISSLVSFVFFLTVPDLQFSTFSLPSSFLILIVGTVICAVVGLILGIITAHTYNYVAKTAGGLKVELNNNSTKNK